MLFLLYFIRIATAIYYSNYSLSYNDSITNVVSSTISSESFYSSSNLITLSESVYKYENISTVSNIHSPTASSFFNVYENSSNVFSVSSHKYENISTVFSVSSVISEKSIYSNISTAKPKPRFGFMSFALQTCYGSDEVPMSIIFGYTRGDTKTESNKQTGLRIVDIMKNAMAVESRESFYTEQNNVYGFMWVGSMVQNRGFKDNLIPIIEDEIRNYGTPKNMYIEYDGKGDPLKSFGFMIDIGSKDNIIKAAKQWSQGKQYGNNEASKQYNPSVCYSSYSNRKKVENDYFVGQCDYFILEAGNNPSDQSGINGESLQGYNPTLSFNSLSPGTPICKSIGSVPDKRPKQNADGSCAIYKIQRGDSCSAVAAKYFPLSVDDINKYNQGNLRWGGCNNFLIDDIMCVSSGTVPKGGCKNAVSSSVSYKIGYYYSGSLSSLKDLVISGAKAIKNRVLNYDQEYTVITINGNVVGMSWLGSMVQNSGAAENMFQRFIDNVDRDGIFDAKFLEYVVPRDPAKSAGIIFDTTGNKDRVFNAIKSWSKGKGLNDYSGGGFWDDSILCYLDYNKRKVWDIPNNVGSCEYFKIESGMDLGSASGITTDALILYNPSLKFNSLAPGTPICKTIGSPPDFRKSPNADGSCYSYTIERGDTCSSVAAKYYPLSIDDINKYNKDNFAWSGCDKFFIDDKMCVSSGTPPRPKSDPNAECGPYAPGDLYLAKCPLNACCSRFGYCGYEDAFCSVEQGCFSNCERTVSPINKASSFNRIVYWMDDENMKVDPTLLNYDIIHYGFVPINKDLSIDDSKFANSIFQSVTQSKRVASFGGWEFSTNPSTYTVFRDAMSSNVKQELFANNLANFAIKYNLDGIDLDWEYPGAPDIPNIPADNPKMGFVYLDFLKKLRQKLRSQSTLSIAIPASHWYLKPFPISEIQHHVNYMVFMTYDYYGAWDKDTNVKHGIDCHVDIQSVKLSLNMLNKAGVMAYKVYGGLANYGRSYKVSSLACTDTGCPFVSGGNARTVTNTPGVLAMSEINSIIGTSSANVFWKNETSQCYYMRYDSDSIVSWSVNSGNIEQLFKDNGFSGSSLWVSNYEQHDSSSNSDTEDDLEYYVYDDFEYIDLFDCANFINDDLCVEEKAIKFAISNTTEYIKIVKFVMSDRKNYQNYYNAYMKFYYNLVMDAYAKWYINKGRAKYYTKTVKDIVLFGELPPSQRITYFSEEIISDSDISSLIQDFAEATGYNVPSNAFVTGDYVYTPNKGYTYQYRFMKSTVLEPKILFPNVLDNLSIENVEEIESIVELAKEKLGLEGPSDILEIMEASMMFSELGNMVNFTYYEGKAQKEKYDKNKKLFILQIVLSVFSIAGLFLSGPISLTFEAIVGLAGIIASSEINGSINFEDIFLSLIGAFVPSIRSLKSTKSFSTALNDLKMSNKISDNFGYVKDLRKMYKQCSR